MISQGIITAAGLGTRMLPISKEIPKEMLPVPFNGELKPIVQVIFEQLYDNGVKDFIFVVSKNKRVIEDYFTPDYDFVNYLEFKGKIEQSRELKQFYRKIEQSNLAFVNQHEPKGFGDAVLRAEPYANQEFLVAAADTIVKDFKLEEMNVNSFLVTKVDDPRSYGVVTMNGNRVADVEEKPKVPKSNLIIVPYYVFDRRIFTSLKSVDYKDELQLTCGIKKLIRDGVEFTAVEVSQVYDLGNFKGYVEYVKSGI
ncbi:sugar phosphate nucleotidyltransferase [Sulfuracidifex metallicus]|uniref:sugar phosphate nucleotidyltransferase n=1 Tax=Sulfuracidifex metallicus TaxID=47303 RepID=UPI00227428CB|nr:sugar phosphate nucleotidyltransferase [Sulfuracidifex metallicus]MCY0851017.1 sugar phosphate nucleotidyltransferase [Sulfuracidifex metallicus]